MAGEEAEKDSERPEYVKVIISAQEIHDLGITGTRGVPTINRFFSRRIFHATHRGGETARVNHAVKDSIIIRYGAFGRLAAKGHKQQDIGDVFEEVCGNSDEFIMDKLVDGTSLDDIEDQLFDEALSKLEP